MEKPAGRCIPAGGSLLKFDQYASLRVRRVAIADILQDLDIEQGYSLGGMILGMKQLALPAQKAATLVTAVNFSVGGQSMRNLTQADGSRTGRNSCTGLGGVSES